MDFTSLKVSASALTANKTRMDTISANLANINTTRTEEGGPYKRQEVIFKATPVGGFKGHLEKAMGVEVSEIKKDGRPPKLVYDPSHPDSNEQGYVAMPNVNLMKEMVNMMLATRSFEANTTALSSSKSMFMKALEIGR